MGWWVWGRGGLGGCVECEYCNLAFVYNVKTFSLLQTHNANLLNSTCLIGTAHTQQFVHLLPGSRSENINRSKQRHFNPSFTHPNTTLPYALPSSLLTLKNANFAKRPKLFQNSLPAG